MFIADEPFSFKLFELIMKTRGTLWCWLMLLGVAEKLLLTELEMKEPRALGVDEMGDNRPKLNLLAKTGGIDSSISDSGTEMERFGTLLVSLLVIINI